MMVYNSIAHLLNRLAGSISYKDVPTDKVPYSLTAVPSLVLMLVLVTVLVLALAYNARFYKPPEVSYHEADSHDESATETE